MIVTTSVLVGCVGMIPFAKPGTSETYYLMAAAAVRAALQHGLGIGGAAVVTLYRAD
jgi:hypothetical protein